MKKKILFSSLLTILLSATLLSGATYSLFTSESKNDISITSASVSLKSYIKEDSFILYSMDEELKGTTFTNGGKVYLDSNKNLVLENLTPGDKVSFKVHIVNESNVDIKYRGVINLPESELVNVLSFEKPLWPGWQNLKTSDQKEFDVELVIGLVKSATNEYQGKEIVIPIGIEAVQANGTRYLKNN